MSIERHEPSTTAERDQEGRAGLHFGVNLSTLTVRVGITNPLMEETSDGGFIAVVSLDLLTAVQAIRSLADMYEVVVEAAVANGIGE